MNLSLNWLNDYVKTDKIPLAQLVSGLTMSGSKVEKHKDLAEPLSKVVIGKVVEMKKHENSDKLWLCKVEAGFKESETGEKTPALYQIVTGAQNVFEGAIVPVVLDGGVVLNRHDSSVIKIKKGKLRGEVSEGMLCSTDELGIELSENAVDGIWILNDEDGIDEVELGSCMLEFLGLKDTVIEFEITNNRPDCFSITGLAREVSATFDLPLNLPEPSFDGNTSAGDIKSEILVKIENEELCSRYMAGLVKNVKITPSPKWLASRLKAQGIRPINNIVDITNYVMLEYGNPLHAFDKRFINDGGIIVRNARVGEKITLLDGNTVDLAPDILVIASGKDSASSVPVAVAGVMGGEHSGVVDDTDTVVFEAACFDKVSVRRAAKKVGRRTESSSRFEKGLAPQNTKTALLRALQLVEELKCGEVCSEYIDVCGLAPTITRTCAHDSDAINRFLGTNISQSEQKDIFKKLGFGYDDEQKCVIVPTTRSDINLQCDLAEEVARIYGYDKIESTLPRLGKNAQPNSNERNVQKLVNVLTAQGCRECITYSFVSPKMNAIAGGGNDEKEVVIRNPFGDETSVMRTTMAPSILKVIANNLNHRNMSARLFELGRVYETGKETDMLCIALYGKNESFFTLKGVLEEIASNFKIDIPVERYTESPFHPGRGAKCEFAKFGEISPLVLQEYDISERVYVAEVDLKKLFDLLSDKTTYTQIPTYPASIRDLSLVCDDETASGTVVEIISKACKKYLDSVDFFDVFNLENGKKSLSYKLTFRKPDGTLTDEEVDTAIKQILNKLEENNIKLRG